MPDKYEGITHVVQVSTQYSTACEHCDKCAIGGEDLADSVNHYIADHGYRLLHVGSDYAGEDNSGAAMIYTVAVLGR